VSSVVQQHGVGITWTEPGGMARAAHAVARDGRVWLIDPFDDRDALDAAGALGEPAGVLQLLDRHNRDCQAIAGRLGVPLLHLPERAPETPFDVVRVISRPRWREAALWLQDERALIIAEAIGTAPAFALGRRAGVHPLLRLTPPRSQFSSYRPEMLLVGHGATLESDAASALDEALSRSRADIPRFVAALPKLIRSR
jgi:hypothetical protein